MNKMLFEKGLKVNNNTTIQIVDKLTGGYKLLNNNSYKLGQRMKKEEDD